MPRSLVALLAALLLSCGLVPAYSCAAALPAVIAAADVVTEVLDWIGVIERTASQSGLLPPDVQALVDRARRAAEALEPAADKGVEAYLAAVEAWERAYAELTAATAPMGVRAVPAEQRRLGAAPGQQAVPTASELGARLRGRAR
jgi:hypothetical protein